jgi:hypothetical protein
MDHEIRRRRDLDAAARGSGRVLGGFEGALVKFESGGKANLVNPLGYAGLYQFGAPRLPRWACTSPATNEDSEELVKDP